MAADEESYGTAETVLSQCMLEIARQVAFADMYQRARPGEGPGSLSFIVIYRTCVYRLCRRGRYRAAIEPV